MQKNFKKESLLEKLKSKMGIDGSDDKKSDHGETSAPKQKGTTNGLKKDQKC